MSYKSLLYEPSKQHQRVSEISICEIIPIDQRTVVHTDLNALEYETQ